MGMDDYASKQVSKQVCAFVHVWVYAYMHWEHGQDSMTLT